MTVLKTLFAVSAVTIALAVPAVAQSGITIPNESLFIIEGGGKGTPVKASKMAHDMMMKHGRPVGAGIILYMNQGKLYWMADKKMKDGRMMSNMFQDGNSQL